MDEHNKFLISVYGMIATCFIVTITMIAFSCITNTREKANLIAKGADPIKVLCALDTPADSGKLMCDK